MQLSIKFIDFINALIFIFDIKKYNNDFEDIFCNCIHTIKKKNNFQKLNKEKAIINKINKDTYEEISIIQEY